MEMQSADRVSNRLSPSLGTKRILASLVPTSVPGADALHTPVAVLPTSGDSVSETPVMSNVQPLAISPAWLRNDLRYKATMTPPACVAPLDMITPDAEQVHTHDESVDEKYVPNMENCFASLDDAFAFYKNYASLAGFPVKRNRKRNNGTAQEFCCSFEGKHKPKVGDNRQREKTSMRTGCKAMVKANQSKENGSVFFTRIQLCHNHKLTRTPRMTRRMRAHKVKDPSVLEFVDTLHEGNVKHNSVMRVLKKVVGGSENLSLTERDIQNRRAARVREERTDDIPKLLQFFKECKRNNPQFFYEFQVDADNVVRNVFWSHASQQGDYADFGDVVTFDTTYRTNIYSMPLAMFVGFNHQLQNVVFAQALIGNEQADTFEWVFSQFQNCMRGKDPITIFTDEDAAMEIAIPKVFKRTHHRNCRWHVLKKYKDELNQSYGQHEGLHDLITSIINHPLTPVEFQNSWAAMLEKYSLQQSRIMLKLYDTRTYWIAAYFKEIFCGTVTSTQRSESVNSVVKSGYADNSTAIQEFAKSFVGLLEHTRENETQEEYNSQAPNLTYTYYKYEIQLSRVYSRAVYKEFRERLRKSTRFVIRPDPDQGGYYLVEHTKGPTDFPWLQHEYRVKAVVDKEDKEASVFNCECMLWEHTGMFCSHVICCFTYLQVDYVPAKYILKRYTRDPHVEVSFDRHDKMFAGVDGSAKQQRSLILMEDMFGLQRSAIKSEERYEKCRELLKEARSVVEAIPLDVGTLPAPEDENVGVHEDNIIYPSAPPVSTTKGSRKRSRISTSAPPESTEDSHKRSRISTSAPPVSTEDGGDDDTEGEEHEDDEDDETPIPHFRRPATTSRKRRCTKCNRTGHKSTTCGRPPKEKRPRGRPKGTGGGKGSGKGGSRARSINGEIRSEQ